MSPNTLGKELWQAAAALGSPLQVGPDVGTRLEPNIRESERSLG